MNLGEIGVWSSEPYFGDANRATDLAIAAEELGYGTLWIPGFDGGHVFERCAMALEATSSLNIATGVVNIWRHDAEHVAETVQTLQAEHDHRFLLGIGVSHRRLIGDAYGSPLAKMNGYLDGLDAAGQPAEGRCLGALGREMSKLSGQRSAGSHPYFVPVEHTAATRELLGDGPLLMPEVTVVLETDPVVARGIGREFAELYLRMPNYTNNLRRLGFTDGDLAEGGSDRLIDAVVAWGDRDAIEARVREHLAAGADHVTVQSWGPKAAVDVWRELAPALLG